ncbi:MaoC family dehydratase [Magnetovibrio sp. PR-2]|uniref:MaoC family dehydratase n=1 Tax=Magnetovibrio sp. PR-2 TaxID=3120356 RepID=UPI002FCDFF96
MIDHMYDSVEQLQEGDAYTCVVNYTDALVEAFAQVSADQAPVHMDDQHAQSLGFESRIVHGLLINSAYSKMLGMHLPGPNTVIQQLNFDMLKPVYVDDTLEHRVEVAALIEAVKGVKLRLSAVNQVGTLVNRGSALCVFRSEFP